MYIDKFQSLIAHSSSGEKKSIKEQVEKQISYATREDTRHLFSDAKVRKIVYYIISFLGNQAKKEASRRAKDSGGVSKCLCFLSQHCFLVRNHSDSESKQIDMLISDEDEPTDMISYRERHLEVFIILQNHVVSSLRRWTLYIQGLQLPRTLSSLVTDFWQRFMMFYHVMIPYAVNLLACVN